MDAATLTIDLDKRRCCYCSHAKARCFNESCLCFKEGRQCDSSCESTNWTSDCLNKPVVRCHCSHAYNTTSLSGKPEEIFCNQDNKCPCYRYNETCTIACGCRGECSNLPGHDHNNLDYHHFPKLERPLCGCSCSSRGGCKKFKKCLCLQSLSYCGSGCKCKRDCTNTKTNFELSKRAKNSFFDPEESPSGSVAVLHIIGPNYAFQLEFPTPNAAIIHSEEILCRVLTRALSVYSIPIQHLIVYTPTSPCFHQDCHPHCEMVDSCVNGKSCATALAVLYGQLRKLTRNTHMEMTVRFLTPYVVRGDLYTKRAILALMEAGVRVEPITTKDWSELMRDSVYKTQKRSLSIDRLLHRDRAESGSAAARASWTPTVSACYSLWSFADMDRFVRLSQHYINECRRTLGYGDCYWTSAFHDLLKMTVLACAGAGEKLKHISIHMQPPISSSTTASLDTTTRNRRLQQMKRQSRLSTSEENWKDSKPSNVSAPDATSASSSSLKKKYRIRCHSGPSSYKNSRFQVVDEVVESLSKPVAELDIDDQYVVSSPTTTTADTNSLPQQDSTATDQYESCLVRQHSEPRQIVDNVFSSSVASSAVSLHAPAAVVADKILFNLSGRNIIEAEQQEIKAEVVNAIESIQDQLTALMQYLDQKIASVPV